MQAKTKYVAIAVAVSLSMFALSKCSDNPKQVPQVDSVTAEATTLFECAGTFVHLGANTPNMPIEVQDLHREVASAMYEGAKALKSKANKDDTYIVGIERARTLLQNNDTNGIKSQMEVCYKAAKPILHKLDEQKAQELKAKEQQELKAKQQKEAEAEALKEKELIRGASLTMYECSGIFMAASEIPTNTRDNQMKMGNYAVLTWKLAKAIDPLIMDGESSKVTLMGGVKANTKIQNQDVKGTMALLDDCEQAITYIRDNNIGNVNKK